MMAEPTRLHFYEGAAYLVRDKYVEEGGNKKFDGCEYATVTAYKAGETAASVEWRPCKEGELFVNMQPLLLQNDSLRSFIIQGTFGTKRVACSFLERDAGGHLTAYVGTDPVAAFAPGHWVCFTEVYAPEAPHEGDGGQKTPDRVAA